MSKKVSLRRRALVGAGVAVPCLAPFAAMAQEKAALQPVEDFYRLPLMSGMRMAPGGKHICAVREIKGRLNAIVLDVATRKPLIITNFDSKDVRALRWISPDRLVFGLMDRNRGSGDQLPEGLYAINRDGSDFVHLTGEDDPKLLSIGTEILYGVRDASGKYTGEVIAKTDSMQAKGKLSSDLRRLDTVTRKASLLTIGGPHDVLAWVLDKDYVPRAAVSSTEGVERMHVRDSAEAPWRVVFEHRPEEVTKAVTPLAFDAKGTLYVAAYGAGADNTAIYRLPAGASKLEDEPVFAIKGFDVGSQQSPGPGPVSENGLLFNADRSKLLGIAYDADRRGVYWLDPEMQAVQKRVDAQLPDTVNTLYGGGNADDAHFLVASTSDRDPGHYYLFNAKTGDLDSLSVSKPWIKPQAMRPATFYRYTARDGLSIPAQLTLPEGKGKFPLVVLHYGGPWVRPIEWQWDGTVQFLASRGYAVFMPAPRASTGFGAKLFSAGWKQWGLAMQDDVTDGVLDLIKRGIVDPDRVCLAGASYGGYLTMMGLAKEPKLFKCGINWVGVTDPSFMFTVTWTDFNQVDAARFTLPLLIGDPDKDREQFKRTSPVELAARITQPVLMAYGGLDRRVPMVNGERMRDALKPHNPNVEWVVYPDEGHGWSRLDHDVDFWNRVEAFLKKNL